MKGTLQEEVKRKIKLITGKISLPIKTNLMVQCDCPFNSPGTLFLLLLQVFFTVCLTVFPFIPLYAAQTCIVNGGTIVLTSGTCEALTGTQLGTNTVGTAVVSASGAGTIIDLTTGTTINAQAGQRAISMTNGGVVLLGANTPILVNSTSSSNVTGISLSNTVVPGILGDNIPIYLTGAGSSTSGYGVRASNNSSVTLGVNLISNFSTGMFGIRADTGGKVSLLPGSTFMINGVDQKPGGAVLIAVDPGSIIDARNTNMSIAGTDVTAINMTNGGLVKIDATTGPLNVTNYGTINAGSAGIVADNTIVPLGTIDGAVINFAGIAGTGITATNGAQVWASDFTIKGAGIGVIANANSSTYVSDSKINITNSNGGIIRTISGIATYSTTFVRQSAGLVALGGEINANRLNILVPANNAYGLYSTTSITSPAVSGVLQFSNGTVNTSGSGSHGAVALGSPFVAGIPTMQLQNAHIATTGIGAHGLVTMTGGNISSLNSYIHTEGLGSFGLYSTSTTSTRQNNASLAGGNLISTHGTAIQVESSQLTLSLSNGIRVIGGNGILTEVINSSVEDISATTHSFLIGNAIADAGSTLNMSLASNSLWSGAAINVNNLIIDSSIWDLTGSSTVNNLTNDGLIHFVPNGNNFKTLTVNNDYVGLNGTINLNTFIQGSESLSDLIVINSGHASGSTSLNIYNTSGLGALTSGNGILIVDAINGGTTDNSAFNLGSPVVAGPFEYRLYRSGIDGSNEHNWYLRDVCPPDRPLCSLEPAPDTSPLVPRNAEYRSEIGLYPVLSAMTLLYGQTLLDSLHQRVGPGSSSNRIWNRAIGLHGDRNRLTNKNPLRSSDYDYNFGIIQLGSDLLQRETEGNKRHHLGIYGAIGQGQGDVRGSNFTLGSNQFGALSAGAYWTIYSAIEAYVDTVVQTTWYNQAQSKSYRLSALKTDGWGFAASVEGGYPIIFNKQWTIEPQAQAIVQTINLHNTKDIGAFIHFRETDAVTGRLGVRLAHKWVIDNHGQSKDFTTWIRPNLWYQFKGNPQAQFSSAYGFIPFQAQLEGSSVELNLGASLGIGQNIALYANGSYGVGLNMHMNSYDGRIGFKIMVA